LQIKNLNLTKTAVDINKEIFSVKMFITTDCMQKCRYCFVNKDGRYMSFNTAVKIVDLLFSSPGKKKLLRFYGGEPLLNFYLIKKITPYALEQSRRSGKELELAICTNGVILDREHIDFFKKYKFKVGLSIDGRKKDHQLLRFDKDKIGTFDTVISSAALLTGQMEKKNIDVELVVDPATAPRLFSNFKYVLTFGFDTVCIAPSVSKKDWPMRAKKEFLLNLLQIGNYILKEIRKGNYIYVLTLNQELVNGFLSRSEGEGLCNFYRSMEVLPNGEIGFSAFMMQWQNKRKYIIGNINKDITGRYAICKNGENKEKCRLCSTKYFRELRKFTDIYRIRNIMFMNLAKEIKARAATDSRFYNYIKEACEHINF